MVSVHAFVIEVDNASNSGVFLIKAISGIHSNDSLLELDASSYAVNNGLLFTDSFTDAIDASDANIDNALNVGPNTITGTAYAIKSTTGDLTLNPFNSLVVNSADFSGTPGTAGSIIEVQDQIFTDNVTVASGTVTAHVFSSLAQPIIDS